MIECGKRVATKTVAADTAEHLPMGHADQAEVEVPATEVRKTSFPLVLKSSEELEERATTMMGWESGT